MRPAFRLITSDRSSSGAGGAAPQTIRNGNGHKHVATILVVEDEFLVRMSVSDHLRDCGYRVLEASTAAEAQSVFEAGEPIELVFSDVTMPGDLDGRGLALWVRHEHPDVQIILTSGAVTAREAGGIAVFLRKPYGLDELERTIKTLLKA
jgi:DNA-binding NtrC family response regulator